MNSLRHLPTTTSVVTSANEYCTGVASQKTQHNIISERCKRDAKIPGDYSRLMLGPDSPPGKLGLKRGWDVTLSVENLKCAGGLAGYTHTNDDAGKAPRLRTGLYATSLLRTSTTSGKCFPVDCNISCRLLRSQWATPASISRFSASACIALISLRKLAACASRWSAKFSKASSDAPIKYAIGTLTDTPPVVHRDPVRLQPATGLSSGPRDEGVLQGEIYSLDSNMSSSFHAFLHV